MARTIMPLSYTDRLAVTSGVTRWKYNVASDDVTACEPIVEAPGSGYELCLQRLRIAIGAAITVTIGEGKTGSALAKTLFGSLGGAAGGFIDLDFRENPIVLDANRALMIDASGAGKVSIIAEGFTRAATASTTPSSSPSTSKSSSVSASVSSSPSSSVSGSPSSSISSSGSSSPSSSVSGSPSSSISSSGSSSPSSSVSGSDSSSVSSSGSATPSSSKSQTPSGSPSQSPSVSLSPSPSASASA